MKKLRLLIPLSLILVVTLLIPCKDFVKAESPPDSKVNEKSEKIAVSKDVIVEDRNIINTIHGQSPIIFFEKPNFNFGKIYKGQKIEHIFKFENKGHSDLEISKAKSTCGCTATILKNKIISPGKTGEIKTTFNSGSYKGKVTKSITVKSNDPKSPNYTLTISGEIAEIISTSPRRINFGSVYVGEKTDRTVTVTSDSNFRIKGITPSRLFLNAAIVEENENGYTINVTSNGNREI